MGLQQQSVEYLESKGWYFDWEWIADTYWADEPREEAIRQAAAWTVPQWGEYWTDPRQPEKPPTRRYVNLKEALWSQIEREEQPEQFGVFFGDEVKS